MERGHIDKDFIDSKRFEDAAWILTHKTSQEKTKYNYQEMCKVIKQAYVDHQKNCSGETLSVDQLRVRAITERGCVIAEIQQSFRVLKFFDHILPGYDIRCYGWFYKCSKCDHIFRDEMRKQGEQRLDKLYCIDCGDYVDV